MVEARDSQFREGRKDIIMLEGSQDLPARPSEGSSIKKKHVGICRNL